MSSRTLWHLPTSWQELKEAVGLAISHRCSTPNHLHLLHGRVISSGLRHNQYIASLLVAKYFSFGDSRTARLVFDAQRERPMKALIWNSLIRGYLKAGSTRSALNAYLEMVRRPSELCEPDKLTFHIVITACVDANEFRFGSEVGRYAKMKGFESDILVGTALVDMYSKVGDLEAARKVFDGMATRDAVAWSTLIAGYSRAGSASEAVSLFKDMRYVHGVQPTEAIMVSLISACGRSYFLKVGESLHADAVKLGLETSLFVLNSLLQMYIDCGSLNVACEFFNNMISRDAVTLSTMIGGYVRQGYPHHALNFFKWMVFEMQILPTRPILLNVIRACADSENWEEGKLIVENYMGSKGTGFFWDSSVATALIFMCAKCGKLEMMLNLLERDEVREDVVAWNAAMEAFIELQMVNIVWDLSSKMLRRGITPDHVTIISLLSAMSCNPCLKKAMETHAQIVRRGFEMEKQIMNSLIDGYAKCGSISASAKVFDDIIDKDEVSWSIMIKAYAWNGKTNEVLNSFDLMRVNNIRPNHFSFLSLLSACSHAGLVDKGWEFFNCMKKEYGLEPGMEHFTCMVDMFCRAARLSDAYHFLEMMAPVAHKNAALWGTLLSACRLHGNLMIGEAAGRHLFRLEPSNVGNYRLLADIFVSAGRREEANDVLEFLKAKGLEKVPGCSWIESG